MSDAIQQRIAAPTSALRRTDPVHGERVLIRARSNSGEKTHAVDVVLVPQLHRTGGLVIAFAIVLAVLLAGLSALAGMATAYLTGNLDMAIPGVAGAFALGLIISQALSPLCRREQDLRDTREAARQARLDQLEHERKLQHDRENIELYERMHGRGSSR